MIISNPRIIDEGDEIRLCADVRFDAEFDAPETVWFRFPAEYRPYVNERCDAMLVGVMPVASLVGEDIVVEGPVSRRLAFGIREYLTAYNQWWPHKYSNVDVTYAELVDGGVERADRAVGGTFSGGVDSFYSILQHMPGRERIPGLEITHCLIVNGFNFDVDLERSREFQQLFDFYRPLLERHGIELLVATHNAQMFQEAAERAFGSLPTMETGILAPVLALGNLYSAFYLPGGATYRYRDNVPHGWHPMVLPMLSTGETQLIFDGGDATRAEKTIALSKWEETYRTLRVCWRPTVFNAKTGIVENCCRCPKCLRTMATLEMAGALSKYETFPEPLDRKRLRATHHVSYDEKLFYEDMVDMALAHGRGDIVRDLRYARLKSRIEAAIRVRLLRRPNRGRG